MKTESINKRYIHLALGCVGLLFAGVIYAWSILKAPLEAEFGWTTSQLALNFTLTMCFFCVGGIVSGFTIRKLGPKVLIVASGLITGAGFVLSSRNNGSLWMLYISYGVMSDFGIGVAYNAILACTGAWFPDRKGLCSGCLMMGFGASTLVIGSLAGRLISAPAIGWRTVYLTLGLVTAAVLTVSGLHAAFPPDSGPGQSEARSGGGMLEDYTPAQMLKNFTFWRFYLFTITMAAVGNAVISVTRDIALSIGAQAALATSLVGVLSVCNGLGRLASGVLFDAVGRRATMIAGNVITLVAPALLLAAVRQGSLALGITGLCLCGLSYGFSPSISSAVCSSFYGQKHYAINFAITNTMLIPTSFIATLVGSMVTASGSFISTFVLLIVLAAVSLLLGLSIKKP